MVSEPASFSAADAPLCEGVEKKCDHYQLLIQNTGDKASEGPITVIDHLPAGIKAKPVEEYEQSGEFNSSSGTRWRCERTEGDTVLTCRAPDSESQPAEVESVPAGHYAPFIDVIVTAPSAEVSGMIANIVTVEGGGAAAAISMTQDTEIGKSPAFEPGEFDFAPLVPDGGLAQTAGGHPAEITTAIGIPAGFSQLCASAKREGHFG
jgi:hypothetical protein